MINGPSRKFCEGIITGLTATEAYVAAYPRSSRASATHNAARLLAKPEIRAEIDTLRAKADAAAGSAVLQLVEKRRFLARIVRSRPSELHADSDLWIPKKVSKGVTVLHLPDKLRALALDNDLAGVSAKDEKDQEEDPITAMLLRVRASSQFGKGSPPPNLPPHNPFALPKNPLAPPQNNPTPQTPSTPANSPESASRQ